MIDGFAEVAAFKVFAEMFHLSWTGFQIVEDWLKFAEVAPFVWSCKSEHDSCLGLVTP